ncbi:zinc-binding dehydrogenase [Leptolyngbya sp. PCC 6406]|uniref:zinc-binding dehydrogenase n=1 Tax=Leptolyngbya sp. PCC 6406 TaxID=1173264 RepID=UPI0002ACEB47|nr:zinc-binding dehydrogenase [Leptolyngbya sp. PCC 6406]
MKAIVMSAPGEPEVLRETEQPIPEFQTATEIRVRLKAAGVNPVDTKIRQRGVYLQSQGPTVLGLDGAGIVDAVGPGVRHFSIGDAVYFCSGGLGGARGTYAEYTIVEEAHAAHKPERLSFAEAAAAPLVLITAWEALHDRARITAGQQVLIHGGGGGVGHVAIQLAHLAGALVATTVSSETKAEMATRLGADHCIYYPHIDFVESIQAWTQNQGVAIALDTIGEPILSRTFEAVAIGGSVITLLAPTAETQWSLARTRNLQFGFELMLTPHLQALEPARRHQTKILEQCSRWFDSGDLQIHLGQTWPLSQAAEAHRWVEAGHSQGKAVLLME